MERNLDRPDAEKFARHPGGSAHPPAVHNELLELLRVKESRALTSSISAQLRLRRLSLHCALRWPRAWLAAAKLKQAPLRDPIGNDAALTSLLMQDAQVHEGLAAGLLLCPRYAGVLGAA